MGSRSAGSVRTRAYCDDVMGAMTPRTEYQLTLLYAGYVRSAFDNLADLFVAPISDWIARRILFRRHEQPALRVPSFQHVWIAAAVRSQFGAGADA